jgi:hypothetical protein
MEDNIFLFRRPRISSRRCRAGGEPQPPVPTGPKNPLTFSFFPLELREKIFIRCLEWNGKTPALVVAARGDKQLYEEIIEIFYRTENMFVLHRGNHWWFGNMSQRALLSVRKLMIVAMQVIQGLN